MKIRNVILDMDGVTVNSEIFIQKLIVDYYRDCTKYNPDLLNINYLMGSDGQEEIYIKVFEYYKDEIESIDFEKMNNEIYKYLDDHPYSYKQIPSPYLFEFLDYCKENQISVALATNSRKHDVDRMLKELELESYFVDIMTGEMVKERKPFPEIYEKVIKNNNFLKNETIIIEDSYNGIKAAKSSGVFTVAIKDRKFGIDQSNADIIVDSLLNVVKFISGLD